MTPSVLKPRSKHMKGSKERLFVRTHHCSTKKNIISLLISFFFVFNRLTVYCRFVAWQGDYPEDLQTVCLSPNKYAFFWTFYVFDCYWEQVKVTTNTSDGLMIFSLYTLILKSQFCATILSLEATQSIFLNSWLSTIQPDNFTLFLTPEPSAYLSQKQKPLDNELFFHGPDIVELFTVWCSSLSINIFFQASLKISSLQICI